MMGGWHPDLETLNIQLEPGLFYPDPNGRMLQEMGALAYSTKQQVLAQLEKAFGREIATKILPVAIEQVIEAVKASKVVPLSA